ncbi:MAG: hypothetical protein ACI8WB_003111 [Phenylobacterium sp.]|jgi:hypothetical protein
MSITQALATATTAANNLTQQVTDKITTIDNRVTQFQTDATNIVSAATKQISRASIGLQQQPSIGVTPVPGEDVGLAISQAYADGAKHVEVGWSNDGQERHWNTRVSMPVGTSISIQGPGCGVQEVGGSIRTDRACYANGGNGGTSDLGSPMIFKNLEPSSELYPSNEYIAVTDVTELIQMTGNNTVAFGGGTYLHDQGGMCAYAYGSGLISMPSYIYNLPCVVLGGWGGTQFYLSAPLVNNAGGTSTCEVRMMQGAYCKVSSDGPILTADKGFKRLMDKGVAGITVDLLNKQPYQITTEEAGLNMGPGLTAHSAIWFSQTHGTGEDIDKPRLIGTTTWSNATGWTLVQFNANKSEISTYGLIPIEGSSLLLGAR